MRQQHYVVIIEGAPGTNYSAYVPDLPGCIATGDTVAEYEVNIKGVRLLSRDPQYKHLPWLTKRVD